jgi:UDP-hydrolysing UDP-N-acetyl-D-glucosamine 2-epimerase
VTDRPDQSLRLLVVSGTRADFGLWLPILHEARRRGDRFEARLLVTAMHLDPRFGATVDDVRRSGFAIAAEVACTPHGDSRAEMAAALGQALEAMAPIVAAEVPDWLLVLGDRGEQLAAALAALHAGVPIAHLHGGEITRGAVDDALRDLVTRLAHLHLAATEAAAGRLGRMGEEAWRIHRVGAPGLDHLRDESRGDLVSLRAALGLPAVGPYLLVIQHPTTVGEERGVADLEETLAAVAGSGLPAIAVFPNADAGGRAMIDRLGRAGGLRTVPSLPRGDFATLLAGAAALVGNSSSGLIEAPLLRVPAINVGTRQAGRTRGDNVVDVPADAAAISAALERALDPAFRRGLSGVSPYGEGSAAPRILDLLAEMRGHPRLMAKQTAEEAPAGG